MTKYHHTEIPKPQTKSKKIWSRVKKYGLHATSISGAIVTAITIYYFIQINHKHPDLTGEWTFQFIMHLSPTTKHKGLQNSYNISIRQSGSRNEIVEGNGNSFAVAGSSDSAYVSDYLVIIGSKFDDDSLLLNYNLVSHSEIISNGVIKLLIMPKGKDRYDGLFYDSANDTLGAVMAYRKLCIKG